MTMLSNPSPTIVPVIISGGAGSRLWPASRESFPKQFIPLLGERSLFQQTLERLSRCAWSEPVVITHEEFRFTVRQQMRSVGVAGTILLEPMRRESGPAIAAAAAYVQTHHPDALVLILPSDHLVADVEGLRIAVTRAASAATEGRIATFGMVPDRPHTGYGYIKPGAALFDGVAAVDRFVEKPDALTAARYVTEGYLWNSGMFLFRADAFLQELARFAPAMASAAQDAVVRAEPDLGFVRLNAEAFATAPKLSLDYALMEKTTEAAVVRAAFGWSDVGNWAAVWDASPHDAKGNAVRGDVELVESERCQVQTAGPLTVVVGMSDTVVVVEEDAVLVSSRSAAEQVKQVVDRLKARDHTAALTSRRVYRPWGYYQPLERGPRYQVKRIVVDPGGRLSLQSHAHRAEHWVVVTGTAEVTVDKQDRLLTENQSIYIPVGAVHRLGNPGKIPLELIEVQSGAYLGEDDIVRYDDVYQRG